MEDIKGKLMPEDSLSEATQLGRIITSDGKEIVIFNKADGTGLYVPIGKLLSLLSGKVL